MKFVSSEGGVNEYSGFCSVEVPKVFSTQDDFFDATKFGSHLKRKPRKSPMEALSHGVYRITMKVRSSGHDLQLWECRTLQGYYGLSHDQDTIHAEKGHAEMHDIHMEALMFLAGHGIRARTHAHVRITHFPTCCAIRTWKALTLWPRASQALMMHVLGKYAISSSAWVLDISSVLYMHCPTMSRDWPNSSLHLGCQCLLSQLQ